MQSAKRTTRCFFKSTHPLDIVRHNHTVQLLTVYSPWWWWPLVKIHNHMPTMSKSTNFQTSIHFGFRSLLFFSILRFLCSVEVGHSFNVVGPSHGRSFLDIFSCLGLHSISIFVHLSITIFDLIFYNYVFHIRY